MTVISSRLSSMTEPRVNDWPFAQLRPLSYQTIMVDPPWAFKARSQRGVTSRSAGGQYSTMSLEKIKGLPVGDLAGGDCLLWLWATHPMIREAIEVLDAWGFRFLTSGVWVKRTCGGKLAFGTGYRLRCASEPFMLGAMGKPSTTRAQRTVIEGPLREHSRKPDEAYAAAERLMPRAFRADLFARERRAGWDGWGDELEKFVASDAQHMPPIAPDALHAEDQAIQGGPAGGKAGSRP